MRRRLPCTLKLKPELPNKGILRVLFAMGDGYLVKYDVKTPQGRYVMDQRVLTVEQIEKWTGVRLNGGK